MKRLSSWIASQELWLVLLVSPLLLFPSRYTILGLILLPVPWLSRLLAQGRLTVRTSMDIPILGLLAMAIVGLYPSVSLYLSGPKLLGILLGVALFYAMANNLKTDRAVWRGAVALCVGGLGVALVSLVGTDWASPKLFYLPQANEYLPRLMHLMPKSVLPTAQEGFNTNEVGGALAMLLPLPTALLLFGPAGVHKAGLALVVVIMGTTLLLTQSRSAFLGLGVALVVLAVWKYRRALLLLLLAALALSLLTYTSGVENLKDMFLSIQDSTGVGGSLRPEDRMQLWQIAIYMVQDFPLTGIGLNTFPLVMDAMYPMFLNISMMPHAHNLFLQTAVDLGIPGLLAFLGLLGTFAITLVRVRKGAPGGKTVTIAMGLGCGILAYLVYGLTDAFTLGAKPGIFLWAMLGLAAALASLPSPHRKDSPELAAALC